EVYRALAAHARARGALVLFVWHPDRAAVGGAEEVWKGRLAAMAADADVPLLDLLPAYRHAGGAALYVDGLHLGVAGHAVAGRAIGEWLEQAKRCRPLSGRRLLERAPDEEAIADGIGD